MAANRGSVPAGGAASNGTGGDHFEMDQSAESELQRLQKQLQKMEKERIAFVDEKRCKSIKKQKIIDTLKMEKNVLRERLNAIEEGPHAIKSFKQDQQIEQVLKRIENLQITYEQEKIHLWELEGHIKKYEKEMKILQLNQINEKRYNENVTKVQKTIATLENQLDVVNKHYGEVMAENISLRQTIDHMLLERANFNVMWQKKVKKLEQGKKFILDLIDQSTAAYELREELCNKIQNLKEKSVQENSIHMQEMRELQRKLDHDAKLKQFFGVKGQHRTNAELQEREANKKIQQQENMERQLLDSREILNSIKSLCNEQQIDKLAAQFTQQEEENFALFNYVNELSHEVELLNESVEQINDDIEKQKVENESREHSQMETIDVLEKELTSKKKIAEETHQIQLNQEVKLEDLLQGVEKIFRLVQCTDTPILELLSVNKAITINNVKLFLGIIKRQVNKIIQSINTDEPLKILARKDRVPKFNIKSPKSVRT